jgi:RNA polymerase sigma-70 factor (ECF subfamily)
MNAVYAIEPGTGPQARQGRPADEADERRLLAALARGDRDAADRLVESTYRTIFATLLRLTGGDAELAADLTQEAYRKAWAALDGFSGRSRFSTWLFRIAYTTFLNHVRRPHLVTAVDDLERVADAAGAAGPAGPAGGLAAEPPPAADERVVREQRDERLRRAVMALPADLRDTGAARFWGELPVREIARSEGVTGAAIRKRLARATALLAEMLEDDV